MIRQEEEETKKEEDRVEALKEGVNINPM